MYIHLCIYIHNHRMHRDIHIYIYVCVYSLGSRIAVHGFLGLRKKCFGLRAQRFGASKGS